MKHDFDFGELGDETLDRLHLLTTIHETVENLSPALEIQRKPDIEETLVPLPFDQPDFALPSFITDNIPFDYPMNDFAIQSTVNRLNDQAELLLLVSFDSLHGPIQLRVDARPGGSAPHVEFYQGETKLELTKKISSAQVNNFLGSLVKRNKTGDYSAYLGMDPTKPEINERLVAAISENIDDDPHKKMTYFVGETVSLVADEVTFTKSGGDLVTTEFSVEHHAKATRFIVDSRKKADRILDDVPNVDANSDDIDIEHSMQKLDGVEVYEVDVDGVSRQTTLSEERLVVAAEFLTVISNDVFEVRPDELNSENIVDVDAEKPEDFLD